MYTDKVIAHFTNPHNTGEIEHPDGVGEVGNPTCGDLMKIFIKVENDKIIDIKFKTFGCAAAIATSSMITDLAIGKNVTEAFDITRQDVADQLGGLPPAKMHCSNLASDALKVAINDFLKKRGRPLLGNVTAVDECDVHTQDND
nr:Fe-S cluster assembly scaffold protein NifU [Candidatus Sigynarchaeota archaeon]